MDQRGRLVVFFLVSYAFSWFGHLGNWVWPSGAWPTPMNPFGPLMAAIVVIPAFGGRQALGDWWRRVRMFRAPGRIWAAAILGPIAIVAVSILGAAALGAKIDVTAAPPFGDFLVLMPIMVFLGPLPEELSFRGHGQHQLQEQMPAAAAALWIGAGVALWHLPLFLRGEIPPVIAVTLFAVSVVYAWLFVAGGSIWPVVALHWAHNMFGGELAGSLLGAGANLQVLLLTGLYVLWAGLLVWRLGPDLGRRTAPGKIEEGPRTTSAI